MSKTEMERGSESSSRPRDFQVPTQSKGKPSQHALTGDHPEGMCVGTLGPVSTPELGIGNMFYKKAGMDGQERGRDTHHAYKTEGGLEATSRVDLTSEEVGLQYPAPKTRFSRERLDCSGPVSGPPLPSQEPLPGRVKLKGRGIEEEKNSVKKGVGL